MFITHPPASEDTRRIIEGTAREMGFEMNLTKAWAWRPDIYGDFGALRAKLTSRSALGTRDQAVAVCATAAERGDSYCALAWGDKLGKLAGAPLAAAVISNAADGDAPLTPRDEAIAAWARKVVDDPNGTTADDVARLRDAGLADKDIFELTAFIAFRLAFSTINDALGVQPDWQLEADADPAIAAAVNFGRRPAARPSDASRRTAGR
ncbi:carboxymuconolactone decarboxylase family protein [Piscinibacter sakaiensis]|uniref:carboxymuconolactone decarboxylase family protein n=1 Tax=Piscinibacter sakaiensis TaxID=1547922 RepID=UPI003AAF9EF8